MADKINRKVTIDADYFAELYRLKCERDLFANGNSQLAKECDELRNKLATFTSQNFENIISAKDHEIETVKDERNQLNARVNDLIKERDELKSKLEDANKHFCTSATGNKAGDACVVAKRCQDLEAELKAANETNSAQADQLRDALNEAEKFKKNCGPRITNAWMRRSGASRTSK